MLVEHQNNPGDEVVVDVLVGEITSAVDVNRESATYTDLVLTGVRSTDATT